MEINDLFTQFPMTHDNWTVVPKLSNYKIQYLLEFSLGCIAKRRYSNLVHAVECIIIFCEQMEVLENLSRYKE